MSLQDYEEGLMSRLGMILAMLGKLANQNLTVWAAQTSLYLYSSSKS